MNFCAIGPLAMGESLKSHSHHMVLAQYLYDRDYFEFFRDVRARESSFIVMDSGVYEGAAVNSRELLYWCKQLRPDAVVLPDQPGSLRETLSKSLAFADMMDGDNFLGMIKKIDKWKVIHAENEAWEDFTLSYQYDSRIFNGVCFSRLVKSFNTNHMTRVDFIKSLKAHKFWNSNCYHHALGMIDGSVAELSDLRNIGVNSIDSSAPLWRGLHREPLYTTPKDFLIPFDPFHTDLTHIERAISNFEQVKERCA